MGSESVCFVGMRRKCCCCNELASCLLPLLADMATAAFIMLSPATAIVRHYSYAAEMLVRVYRRTNLASETSLSDFRSSHTRVQHGVVVCHCGCEDEWLQREGTNTSTCTCAAVGTQIRDNAVCKGAVRLTT